VTPGELYPCVGFIVTNPAGPPSASLPSTTSAVLQSSGSIKQGKVAIKRTRLSCRSFAANAASLPLHALAYNRGNFVRTLAMHKTAEPWS
jgi:hypothetical protein